MNDVTIGIGEFGISSGSTLSVANQTLTFTGNNFRLSGNLLGGGTFKMQPISGSASIVPFGGISIAPTLQIASGTITAGSLTASR